MKTILLAGGQSKRVKPIADKCFVSICGKTLIEWQLSALKNAGFDQIVIVGNKFNLEPLKKLSIEGMTIEVVEQTDLQAGMKGAMDAAKEAVIGEEEIMVVSSNDVVDDALWANVKFKMQNAKNEESGFFVGYKVTRYFPGGYLKLGEDGFVDSIVEKPGEGNEPSDLVNLVIHVHRDVKALYEALDEVSPSQPLPDPLAPLSLDHELGAEWSGGNHSTSSTLQDDLYEQALQQLFDEQKKYSVLEYDGFWQAVKYPWHLLRLMEFYLEKLERSISDKAQIASTAVINGKVVIEEGVRVFDHSVINGPAYIGKNSIVGNFALVRGSSLGEKCTAGSYTEIARSLLQNEVFTHKNYIGDSIIGSNVSFGSGTVTGNLRLDEGDISVQVNGEKVDSRRNKLGLITGDNIRAGINTSFMPGVKIGSNCMIGAELNIAQDIEENSYVKGTGSQLDIRQNGKIMGKRF